MIEIMPIHYAIMGDLRHYFNSNMKEILLHIEESMRFCEEKKISMGHGKLYWFLKIDQIFFYCNNMLIYKNQIMNTEFQSSSFTEAFTKSSKAPLNEKELEQTMIKDALAASYLIARDGQGENWEGTASHIKKTFCGTDIVGERYLCGTSLFQVSIHGRRIKIFRNYIQKTLFTFPSSDYRMPTHMKKIQVFGEENTYPVPDVEKFNSAACNAEYEYGRGLQNIRFLIKALALGGYEKMHRIALYAGWKCQYNAGERLAASVWLVIDDSAIVDTENWKLEKFQRYMDLLEEGHYDETFSLENLAVWIKEEKEKGIPYTDSHWGGTVRKCIYIGTACTDEQAEKFLASKPNTRAAMKSKILQAISDRI